VPAHVDRVLGAVQLQPGLTTWHLLEIWPSQQVLPQAAPPCSAPHPPPPSVLMRVCEYVSIARVQRVQPLATWGTAPAGATCDVTCLFLTPPHALVIAPCRKHSPRTLILPDVHGLRWLRLCEPHRSCRATAYVTTHPPQRTKPTPNAPTP
jgi:hypothetical protein